MKGTLRVRIEQFAPELGDTTANVDHLIEASRTAGADGVDLMITPELSLTGYELKDSTHRVAMPLGSAPTRSFTGECGVVVGLVELGTDFVPYNAAVHIHAGRIVHSHRKLYLPTYGMFDEGRYFGRGSTIRAYDGPGGWRYGLLICEDLWHPSLPYLLAMDGAQVIIVQAAAGGRGGWNGAQAGRFASWAAWHHLACAAAVAYGVYVIVANRVGVEGSVVFCGGSFIVAPDGEVIAHGDDLGDDRVTADLSIDRVMSARRPSAHARDEDPHLVLRELRRIVRAAP
ncbi:MAG TPA: nitrilase-related carbon-nitrogen hydrolase [Longimicrobiaceae bacterium]|nr:nitrilase-related carbon-nitrogen hydrolase [Longimicrobiaceae bacterium]